MLSEQTTQQYKIKIVVPYGTLGTMMDWCVRNCTDKWFVSESTDVVEQFNNNYQFYFESERDYVNFLLVNK